MENVRELLQELIPEKADLYIKELNRIESEMNEATDNMQAIIARDKKKFNKNIRNDFKSSDLGKELAEAITSGKTFNIDSIL